MRTELMIVMPVYNEQASVRKVVNEWFQEVENWTEAFTFLAINDGSQDGTQMILERLRQQLGDRFEILKQSNSGHGQTCLNGYRLARVRQIPYVFQIDSDGQCDPQYFFKFWRKREDFDVIYGKRVRRDDGWRRLLASKLLWATLLVSGRVKCADANVPYRLMRTSTIAPYLEKVPADFFLANVALAILLCRDKSIKTGVVPIHFRERYGGEPSVRLSNFGTRALELVSQIRKLPR